MQIGFKQNPFLIGRWSKPLFIFWPLSLNITKLLRPGWGGGGEGPSPAGDQRTVPRQLAAAFRTAAAATRFGLPAGARPCAGPEAVPARRPGSVPRPERYLVGEGRVLIGVGVARDDFAWVVWVGQGQFLRGFW